MVDAGKSLCTERGHRVRWGGAFGKDHGHGAVVLSVGNDLFRREAVWRLRKDHCIFAKKCAFGNFAADQGLGRQLEGKTVGESGDGDI